MSSFDPRQVVAAALTFGMFVMLIHMIRTDQYTPPQGSVSSTEDNNAVMEYSKQTPVKSSVKEGTPKKLWGQPSPVLQPCWKKYITSREKKSQGYVLVELSNGPYYHPFQVSDAVILAWHLGATLVLPRIQGTAKETNDGFSQIYNVEIFISTLREVVDVEEDLPDDVDSSMPEFVEVPYRVSSDYIVEHVQPIFAKNNVIQVKSSFSSSVNDEEPSPKDSQAIRCLVMYGALQFHQKVQESGEAILKRLRESSSVGHVIGVDLRIDVLKAHGCKQMQNSKGKKCFNATDVGTFLQRLGFSSNTPIFITQSSWDESLDQLRAIFPNIYTKGNSLAYDGNEQTLELGKSQFGKALDFYLCTHTDVFVPTIPGISYATIAGYRIATGNTQILVPLVSEDSSKVKLSDARSRFLKKKNHEVYSCFCKATKKTM